MVGLAVRRWKCRVVEYASSMFQIFLINEASLGYVFPGQVPRQGVKKTDETQSKGSNSVAQLLGESRQES